MSNYIKTTDFTPKDALLTGNPNKLVKGSELDTEFNAIEAAMATKADSAGGNIVDGTVNTQATSDNSTKIANTAFTKNVLADINIIDGGTF